MKTVSIINNGVVLVDHVDCLVTNAWWNRMNIPLTAYLNTLYIDIGYVHDNFDVVNMFYLRLRKNDGMNDYNLDPWERKFYVFPGDTNVSDVDKSIYRYYKYTSEALIRDVYVIVTTVSGYKVYCVDVVDATPVK